MDYRERIIAAYREQAAKRGFSRVTMDDLVELTGISKRTIYRYFSSKDEIVESVVVDFLRDMERKIEAAQDSAAGPVEQIFNVVRVIIGNIKLVEPLFLYDLHKYYPHLWERIEQFRAERIQQVFERFLAGSGQDCFREVDPKVFTTALLTSIRAVINPMFIIENKMHMEDAIQSLFNIFLYGIVKK
ncbi:TetR/AcrR family transcriptional regulator [Pelotomaculum propionicicum]|uniref:TetR/AcrR family transcriptional regulator n=1 Tax=Pelotomaculum propionicicum TaxID=258475 RepID=UPI003B7B4C2A